jgi:hypothetical protein
MRRIAVDEVLERVRALLAERRAREELVPPRRLGPARAPEAPLAPHAPG